MIWLGFNINLTPSSLRMDDDAPPAEKNQRAYETRDRGMEGAAVWVWRAIDARLEAGEAESSYGLGHV